MVWSRPTRSRSSQSLRIGPPVWFKYTTGPHWTEPVHSWPITCMVASHVRSWMVASDKNLNNLTVKDTRKRAVEKPWKKLQARIHFADQIIAASVDLAMQRFRFSDANNRPLWEFSRTRYLAHGVSVDWDKTAPRFRAVRFQSILRFPVRFCGSKVNFLRVAVRFE